MIVTFPPPPVSPGSGDDLSPAGAPSWAIGQASTVKTEAVSPTRSSGIAVPECPGLRARGSPRAELGSDMTTADAPALRYSSAPGRWVLAVTVLGSGIAALDATFVNIALPAIGRDFHTGIAALQWVVTG